MSNLKLRPEVRKFAEFMEYKLRINDYKGGWQDCPNTVLMKRLRDEVEELVTVIQKGDVGMIVAQEAADIANYAMMLASKAGALKSHSLITFARFPRPPIEK